MWEGADQLFDRYLPRADNTEPAPAPQSQRNFAPASCVDLLRSLQADPQSRVERRLRDNTLMLISSYLEQDQAIARTVPRNVQRRARVARSSSSSDDADASSDSFNN